MRKFKPTYAAGALVLAVNLFVLLGVWHNHKGVEATLTLTERELTLNDREDENSSLSLSLDFDDPRNVPVERLRALGFDTDKILGEESPSIPEKPVFAVVEMEGPAYQQWLKTEQDDLAKKKENLEKLVGHNANKEDLNEAQSAVDEAQDTLDTGTHLFVVDVGPDAAALRARYPDRGRYAILPAKLQVYRTEGGEDNKVTLTTSLTLLGDSVHVDNDWQPFFKGLKYTEKNYWSREKNDRYQPWVNRYQVTLAFGKRLEPWIVKCEPLPAAQPK
jgi:hypothetical protein